MPSPTAPRRSASAGSWTALIQASCQLAIGCRQTRRSAAKARPGCVGRSPRHPKQSIGLARNLNLPNDFTRAIHNADARVLDRNVQSSKIVHAALLFLMLGARTTVTPFHHQPEARTQKSFSYPQARPITPRTFVSASACPFSAKGSTKRAAPKLQRGGRVN
jgi:hypothetical protein